MKDFPDSLFKAAFKITNNGMVILNGSYPIEVNDQFLGILKRTRKEIIGNDLLKCVFKDDVALAKEEIRKNRQVIYEVRFIKGDSSLAHVEVRGHPIMYEGKKCRMLIIRDITLKIINDRLFLERQVVEAVNERLKWEITEHQKLESKLKEMVEEKEWLLKEVNHRVKNNLQIITSILNLQINQLQDEEIVPAMKEFQNRFYALSSIYSSLYQSDNKEEIDISAYLKDLTKNLFISYSDAHKNIRLGHTDRIFLEYSQAITCGLIVNELVSNSIKYAFPGNRKGEVKVSLRQSSQNIRLEVSDDGVGIQSATEKREHDTLGLQLVESLVKQLNNGVFKRRKMTKGMGYVITFTSESYSKREPKKIKATVKK